MAGRWSYTLQRLSFRKGQGRSRMIHGLSVVLSACFKYLDANSDLFIPTCVARRSRSFSLSVGDTSRQQLAQVVQSILFQTRSSASNTNSFTSYEERRVRCLRKSRNL